MFMQWKVPSRLTDGGLADCEHAGEMFTVLSFYYD